MAFISNGTTILDNGAFQASLGSMVLLSEQTASASASISFTTGIDSTYPIYKFEFINIHPSTDNVNFLFNLSTDSGSNYNVTKTTTLFSAYNNETSGVSGLAYESSNDLAQSTADQKIANNLLTESDVNFCGEMFLFNPSSTTFVKHFMVRASTQDGTYAIDFNIAGYGNTTSAIDAIIFRMNSGNIDSGTIKLYGIKDS